MRIIFLSEHDPLKRALKRNLVLATKDGTLNKSCVRNCSLFTGYSFPECLERTAPALGHEFQLDYKLRLLTASQTSLLC